MRGDQNNPADASAKASARARREAESNTSANTSHRAPKRASAMELPLAGIRVFLSLGIAALVIAALFFGRSVLVPLALAVLLSFVLNPLVVVLKRWGVPKILAVVSVVFAALMVLGVAGLFVGNEVRGLSEQLPSYQSNIRAKLRDLRTQIRAPGMFEGAKKTFDVVQREVEAASAESAPAKRVQRVQVVPTEKSSIDQAKLALEGAMGPLSDAALVLVFVIFILLDREDLRDRMLRLWGQNLHRATDAMDEAGERISKYLSMQLLVNVSYGIPMAAGLWLIGVPGALLWGALASVMRFVPYVGPMISAVFPLALAFAVDPGWELVLWTAALIVVLELISNNIIEPWLYGSSTGLSAMSLIVAATFWTAMWGPIGLIMSTPLTVCLLVIGKYLPQLAFLDILLGSQPVLDEPTRIYQRLLADDPDEASEIAMQIVQENDDSVQAFYSNVGASVLRMAVGDHSQAATAEHRLRVVDGMDEVLDELEEQYPSTRQPGAPRVLSMGGKWEIDQLAARMVAHCLELDGHAVRCVGSDVLSNHSAVERPQMLRGDVVCVSWMSTEPYAAARNLCRRIRRAWPHARIVLLLWNLPQDMSKEQSRDQLRDQGAKLGADEITTTLDAAVAQVRSLLGDSSAQAFEPAPMPKNEEKRIKALEVSGALQSEHFKQVSQQVAKRAADIFDIPLAAVGLIDRTQEHVIAMHGGLTDDDALPDEVPRRFQHAHSRDEALASFVVADDDMLQVEDLKHDRRFAGNAAFNSVGVRFYAAAPIRDKAGQVLGVLCLADTNPRELDSREMRLLQAMANDVMEEWKGIDLPEPEVERPPNSATVGQAVPN
ncbi:AI-2E family transporter [Diaphorobacter sp. HDW4B]|uniref:AI-2E family transporter n=1 Tax=Diaphorobacter sp. HDW4B TaxID=2714925 RepID=UPI00140B0B06|nr:AI-2E family transporter [Diaphorobacter sp. HDW4B]QIL72843.1 AI-2E family transporter [Diaphorobacter sp. HDW4B]